MKIGNVSGTVLKRSILKQLHTVRDESMFEPTSEEMCAGIRVKESAPVIFPGLRCMEVRKVSAYLRWRER